MANLYKPKYKQVKTKTGEVTVRKAKKWYARYRDETGTMRREALARDKRVAQGMLEKILKRIEQAKAGMIDPLEEQAFRPFAEHLDDYRKHMKQKDDSPRHIRDTCVKIKKIAKAAKWRRVADILATDVQAYLAELADKGLSIQTRNHYMTAMKTFTRWLYRNRRLRDGPLLHLSLSNTAVDRRHDRRPLSQDEFTLLLEAAEAGPPIQNIPGVDRAMMYILSAFTGLRKGEIGSLTVRSFNLKAKPATVTVSAAYSKRRREDRQVLHPMLAERLRAWLKLRQAGDGEILFPVDKRTCGIDRRTGKMMREDLKAARRKWIAEAEDNPKEQRRRKKCDFLKYIDSQGRYADFHSNRHTFITNLSLAGVSPRDAQELARHSDVRLTMNLYTHVNMQDKARAIEKLAAVGG